MVSAGNLETKSNEAVRIVAARGFRIVAARGVRISAVPPMRGGRDRITSTVEMSRNTYMERGAPEEKMAIYQRGSSNQEIRTVKKAVELRPFGTFANNIK